MKVGDEFELDGVWYRTVQGKHGTCDGCAGEGNTALCNNLPDCRKDLIIFEAVESSKPEGGK